jgi:hypothetical protein
VSADRARCNTFVFTFDSLFVEVRKLCKKKMPTYFSNNVRMTKYAYPPGDVLRIASRVDRGGHQRDLLPRS